MGDILVQLLANTQRKSNDKSSNSDSDDSSGSESNSHTIEEYIDFVKIWPSRRESVMEILESNDIISFKLFESKNITHENMSKWGLSDGIIAQLRDNVSKYKRHLKKNNGSILFILTCIEQQSGIVQC